MERLDKNQWKQYQNLMQDSGKFIELLQNIEWEDGLSADVMQCQFVVHIIVDFVDTLQILQKKSQYLAVEGYFAKSKEGQLGITGEGLLLDNPESKNSISETRDFVIFVCMCNN